jgi:hypothetical protein
MTSIFAETIASKVAKIGFSGVSDSAEIVGLIDEKKTEGRKSRATVPLK